jgi:ADP-ribose diphosphatase
VRLIESEKLYSGRVFDLVRQQVELPSGLRQVWDLVEHPGAVGIAAIDDQSRLVVVRQFRAAAGGWTIEIPAGRLDPGEDPAAAARREFEEETGLRAAHWRPLTSFLPAVGFCSEVLHLFEARGLSAAPEGGLTCDDDEEIDVQRLTLEQVLALEPRDAKTLIAAQALLLARR